jgi:hypothetical protein|tara:strand:+ start:101 stop:361 length:261 start_codon:yes stop_codon:yes gene_type:complete
MYNKRKDNKMDKTILVVEVSKYSWGTSYSIKKHATSLDKASEYLVSLKNLNDNQDVSYELFNRFGQFEVDRIEKVESEETNDEIRF